MQIISQRDGLHLAAGVAGSTRDKGLVFNSGCNSNKGFFAQLQAACRRVSQGWEDAREQVRHAISTEVRGEFFSAQELTGGTFGMALGTSLVSLGLLLLVARGPSADAGENFVESKGTSV